jgi:hypothetical protein
MSWVVTVQGSGLLAHTFSGSLKCPQAPAGSRTFPTDRVPESFDQIFNEDLRSSPIVRA